MKKYFQFSETISGTTYFLRMLFAILLSVPGLIAIIAFMGVFAVEYAEIDLENPESFDQQAFQEKIESNPEEFLRAMKDTFTPFWIISLIISLIPAIWFQIVSYYKRLSALFSESRDKIFIGLIAFRILEVENKYEISMSKLLMLNPYLYLYDLCFNSISLN